MQLVLLEWPQSKNNNSKSKKKDQTGSVSGKIGQILASAEIFLILQI